ncbi:hypothetical protein, partial [Anaplasma phagocytophilum]|uniref:hypothetical protein n=1 Tax=Anaplasma phagocytophilum TaxID=948 RepID=UPI000A49D2E1
YADLDLYPSFLASDTYWSFTCLRIQFVEDIFLPFAVFTRTIKVPHSNGPVIIVKNLRHRVK